MNIKKIMVCLVVLMAIVLNPHDAEAKKRHHITHRARHVTSAPVSQAATYADIVIDAETGQVIHRTSSNELRHPASLTKMMTLYLTFQALEAGRLNKNQYLRVSENASYQSPSKLGLRAGQRLRVEDAILGLVTESANDAAVVLGEALGGSEAGFADLMTRQAHALGMTRTQFRNPSGLPDPEQVTTARDMAILGAALVSHYPQYYPYFSRENFSYAGVYHHNHNHLMGRYDGMDGIKTGYIRASGFNLVASVKRDDRRLVAVVFGGHSAVSRDNQMARLLDQSFEVAEQKARLQHAALVQGEGDGELADSGDEVALPAKVAVIFPPGSTSVAQAYDNLDQEDEEKAVSQPSKSPAIRQKVAQNKKARAAGGGAWSVQIGAFSNATVGRRALSSVVSGYPEWSAKPKMQIQKVSSSGGHMYRARLVSLDKKTAQDVCSYLAQRGKSCLTVKP